MILSLIDIIAKNYPEIVQKYPTVIIKILLNLLEKILKLKIINELLDKFNGKKGFTLIDELFEYLDFSYSISSKDRLKIPSEGKLIIVSNHPLGALDGLALLKAVGEVRRDVKIIANDLLLFLDNLNELLLPVSIKGNGAQRSNIANISDALNNDEALIVFPSAEVSRLKGMVVMDKEWHKGAIYFAQKHHAPILPVYIKAKNSLLFYLVSLISKKLSMFLLPRELFNKKSKNITIKIGEQIPARSFGRNFIDIRTETKLLKKHVYRLGRGQKNIFLTEKNIVLPMDRRLLKKELSAALLLGYTKDEKQIYLTTANKTPAILREIGRLREVTFRKVGEGTGKNLDLDEFDQTYSHIFIWDNSELEIIGAYRFGICSDLIKQNGINSLYSSTLFEFSEPFINKYLPMGMELGRSFVQKRYWNSYALDYLWQGIGLFLSNNPDIKFMFGTVSISNSYPLEVKNLIVYFYKKWFGSGDFLIKSKNRFVIPSKTEVELVRIFNSTNYSHDLKKLKMLLKQFGYSIPTLYRQYTDLSEEGGTQFLDFGIDASFENCVDGFIIVEINKIKLEKKERYMSNIPIYRNKAVNL